MNNDRIFLSPPHVGSAEERLVADAFASNWIAPMGPHVDAFETEFAATVASPYAVALSSGTAALHLSLLLAGVQPGDIVLVSTLTFAASVNPILYVGAIPHFIDSDEESWNMDPELLEGTLARYAMSGSMPKAVILVHLYGQCADIAAILLICERYGVVLIEDAAEALGATYGTESPGTFGSYGVFSFNGNKIITTSGGGMLVTSKEVDASRARKLATQAREPVVHYEHVEIGYNYRLSNVLAAIGRGQLRSLPERVSARRRNFEFYRAELDDVPGIGFMPEAPWGRHSRWLTVITIDANELGAAPDQIRRVLEESNIEGRPVWKPMHQQPVFRQYPVSGRKVADRIFETGLCLPSGSTMTDEQLNRVVQAVKSVATRSSQTRTAYAQTDRRE